MTSGLLLGMLNSLTGVDPPKNSLLRQACRDVEDRESQSRRRVFQAAKCSIFLAWSASETTARRSHQRFSKTWTDRRRTMVVLASVGRLPIAEKETCLCRERIEAGSAISFTHPRQYRQRELRSAVDARGRASSRGSSTGAVSAPELHIPPRLAPTDNLDLLPFAPALADPLVEVLIRHGEGQRVLLERARHIWAGALLHKWELAPDGPKRGAGDALVPPAAAAVLFILARVGVTATQWSPPGQR